MTWKCASGCWKSKLQIAARGLQSSKLVDRVASGYAGELDRTRRCCSHVMTEACLKVAGLMVLAALLCTQSWSPLTLVPAIVDLLDGFAPETIIALFLPPFLGVCATL